MSEPTESVAETNTDAPEISEPTADSTEHNPVDNLMARLQAHFAQAKQDDDEPSGEPPPAPKDEPKLKADDVDQPKEPVKDEPPKADKDEDDPKLELQRAREKSELRRVQSEALKFKSQAEEAARKISELEQLGKTNPVKLIERVSGLTFQQFMERTAKGDFDDNAPQLPPEVQEKLKLVEEWKAEREKAEQEAREKAEREEAQARRAAERERDKPRIVELLDETQYPLLAARDDGADVVLDIAYDLLDKGQKPNLKEIMSNLEQIAAERFESYLTSPKMIKALVAKDSIRTSLVEALGLTQKQAAGPASSSEGDSKKTSRTPPRTVASLNEVPSRSDRALTEEEERAEQIRLFRQLQEAGSL